MKIPMLTVAVIDDDARGILGLVDSRFTGLAGCDRAIHLDYIEAAAEALSRYAKAQNVHFTETHSRPGLLRLV